MSDDVNIEPSNPADYESLFTNSLLEIILKLRTGASLNAILDRVVAAALNALNGSSASILLRQPGSKVLRAKAAYGYVDLPIMEIELSLNEGLVGYVANHLHTVIVGDVSNELRYYSVTDRVRSAILAPIIVDEECLGVLTVNSDRTESFHNRDIRIIEAFADLTSLAIRLAEADTERETIKVDLLRTASLLTATNVASGLAHDLKNGLAAISALADSIGRDPAIRGKKNNIERLARLQEHAKGLFDLTKRLMNLSKAYDPIRHLAYLNDVIQDTMILLNNIIRDHRMIPVLNLDQSLSTRDSGASEVVEIDVGQIGQVLTNLVMNAIDASKSGQRIEVSTRNLHNEWVEFSVRDFGSGIKSELADHIFGMFFTTKKKGSGVGLYSSRLIVEEHNGHIEFNTKVGSGTTFKVLLPKYKKIRESQPIVLIADDQDTIREALAERLREASLSVLLAKSGKEALDHIQHFQVDLAVLDINMPGDGIETAIKIQKDYPTIPILFLTAFDDEANRLRSKSTGIKVRRWVDKGPDWLSVATSAVLKILSRVANEQR